MIFHFDNSNAKFTCNGHDISDFVDTTRPCVFDPLSRYDYYFTNHDGKVAKTIDGDCTVIEECYD